MKELTRIEPEPEVFDSASLSDLEWLAEKPFHGKEDYGDLIRLLIHKVNELTDELNRIKKTKINKTDIYER